MDKADSVHSTPRETASKIGRRGFIGTVATALAAGATVNTVAIGSVLAIPVDPIYSLAELNIGIIKGASNARSNQANLDRLDQLLADPSIYQGTGGERVLQLKKAAKAVGIDVGEGIGGAEAAQAISNQLALQARNPAGGAGMPGAMSDADREYLKTMQPGLEKTPDGNRQIIDVNRRLNQRAIDVEARRQAYIRKNGRLNEGFYADLSDWSNANPIFGNAPQRSAAPASPARSAPMQGARQAPDGNFYVPDPARPGKYLKVTQ